MRQDEPDRWLCRNSGQRAPPGSTLPLSHGHHYHTETLMELLKIVSCIVIRGLCCHLCVMDKMIKLIVSIIIPIRNCK